MVYMDKYTHDIHIPVCAHAKFYYVCNFVSIGTLLKYTKAWYTSEVYQGTSEVYQGMYARTKVNVAQNKCRCIQAEETDLHLYVYNEVGQLAWIDTQVACTYSYCPKDSVY
jgi:hypothetical protein